jgi:uncharacterized repeat protein (TIGR04052 family)
MASAALLTWACGDDDAKGDAGVAGVEAPASGSGSEGGAGSMGGAKATSGSGATGGSSQAGTSGAGVGGETAAAGAGASTSGKAVTIRFQAKVGTTPLNCTSPYPEQVTLIAADGSKTPIVFDERAPFQTHDVALLDFTELAGSCLSGGAMVNSTITGRVPEGNYTGISFVNGVPETLNHKNITMQSAPLQDASMFWGWQSGYRFIVVEILPTSLPEEDAGTTEVGSATFVHIGSVGCNGTNATGYSCTRPNRNRIELTGFDPDTSTIVADFSKVFADIDLARATECHGPNPECEPMYRALGVDLKTGAALSAQSVFHVE